jgi:hypothetical protein
MPMKAERTTKRNSIDEEPLSHLVERLDSTVFGLIEALDADRADLPKLLDEALKGSLWARQIAREDEDVAPSAQKVLEARADLIWKATTAQARRGHFAMGVGLEAGLTIDAMADELAELVDRADAAALSGDIDELVDALGSLGERLLFMRPFIPDKANALPANWKAILRSWVSGEEVSKIGQQNMRRSKSPSPIAWSGRWKPSAPAACPLAGRRRRWRAARGGDRNRRPAIHDGDADPRGPAVTARGYGGHRGRRACLRHPGGDAGVARIRRDHGLHRRRRLADARHRRTMGTIPNRGPQSAFRSGQSNTTSACSTSRPPRPPASTGSSPTRGMDGPGWQPPTTSGSQPSRSQRSIPNPASSRAGCQKRVGSWKPCASAAENCAGRAPIRKWETQE